MLPSIRKAILKKRPDLENKLPKVPNVLKELFETAVPMTRNMEPMTLEEMKKQGSVDPEYTSSELSSDKAYTKWQAMFETYPKLRDLRNIPVEQKKMAASTSREEGEQRIAD